MRRWGVLLSIALLAIACSLFTNLDSLEGTDAQADVQQPDAAADVFFVDAASGFVLSATPGFFTMDPGDPTITVDITALRAGYDGPIAIGVSGGVGSLSTAPTIDQGATTSSFTIGLDPSTTSRGDFTFSITGTGTGNGLVSQTKVVLHIGSLLAANDAGVVTVPELASAIVVKAWGAGGGCGLYNPSGNCAAGASFGGGGGFVSARFDVPGGTALTITEGTGGTTTSTIVAGGGGGGYSSVSIGSTLLLVAGGGGGGGGALAGSIGGIGGGGGGSSGRAGSGVCSGGGASPSAGGLGAPKDKNCAGAGIAGSALQGGAGADEQTSAVAAGGKPGGGAGGTGGLGSGGGGGGGGFFGGGGGGITDCKDSSGGGGSGYVADGGLDATFIDNGGASPFPANAADVDYLTSTAVGCSGGTKPGNGRAGHVVIRLVKP